LTVQEHVFKKIHAERIRSSKGTGLIADEPILRGEIILHFQGKLGSDAETNAESMQINEDLFLQSTILVDDNLNHSCSPNCKIDWNRLDLVAIHDIAVGEEITVNYCCFEYDLFYADMDCRFNCVCGESNCYGYVRGFRYLPKAEKVRLRPFLSPFLLKKLNEGG
jgi:hypothetical protein